MNDSSAPPGTPEPSKPSMTTTEPLPTAPNPPNAPPYGAAPPGAEPPPQHAPYRVAGGSEGLPGMAAPVARVPLRTILFAGADLDAASR